MADRGAPSPGEPPRRALLRGLLRRTGALARRTDQVASRAADVLSTLRATLQPLRGSAGEGEESVTGFVSGHRVVAGSRLTRAPVALTFEGDGVRVLQHFGPRVVGWGCFPLGVDHLARGEVVDAVGLGDSLSDIFDRAGLSRGHVVGALSARRARSALLEVPALRLESDLEAAVAEESARRLGHAPGETYLFWQRTARPRHGRAVFALVIPQEPLLLLLEALEAAQIRPESFDLKPLALARAVNQRDAIIASLEPDGLDVVVVSDDLPVAIRSVGLPAGISVQGARELLIAEVVRALAGYGGARTLLDADARIYLAGAVADLSMGEQLRLQTGHELGKLAPPAHFPPDFPVAEQLSNLGLMLKRE